VYRERGEGGEGVAFPLCLAFSSAHKFLPIQQCSIGSRKPKITLLVERGRDGEDPFLLLATLLKSTVDEFLSFQGAPSFCRVGQPMALPLWIRVGGQVKNGGGRCCKNRGMCPIPLSVRFVAKATSTAMAIWPLKCNIVKVNQ